MKTKHDGDCSFYATLTEGVPEAGICTCGYAHQLKCGGDCSEMYSKELIAKIQAAFDVVKV